VVGDVLPAPRPHTFKRKSGPDGTERTNEDRESEQELPTAQGDAREFASRGGGAGTLQSDWQCGASILHLPRCGYLPNHRVLGNGTMASLQIPALRQCGWRAERSDRSYGRAGARVGYSIGGISFGMFADGGVALKLDRGLRDFAIAGANAGAADFRFDVDIRVGLVDSLPNPSRSALFDSGGLWSLFEEEFEDREGYRLSFQRSFPGETPYKSAWFDRSFENGELLLSRKFFREGAAMYPLEYPLDELLMIHRLACGVGLEVHAVGIVDEDGRGHLFLGHSGAGKSTTARLWWSRPGVRILSDDRIVLRFRDGELWMYGTPWHGDAGISSAQSALVTNIYFLEQFARNQIVEMAPGVAAAELFARSFVPRHAAEGLEFALGFIERVTREIPCRVFRFVPQPSAVEAIRDARG
jgi:hypothetical protein